MTIPKVKGFKTPKAALAAVAKVVKGHEDFVYEAPGEGACVYTERVGDDLVPSCLIGKAWHLEGGVDLEWLHGVDTGSGPALSTVLAPWVARVLGLSGDVGELLGRIQATQDNNGSWGAALQAGQDYLDGLDG